MKPLGRELFLIADTRSGSTTLSDALACSLGVRSAGEIFYDIESSSAAPAQRLAVASVFSALQKSNGFVAKVMYHDLLLGQGGRFRLGGTPLVLAQIEQLFPKALLIHLTRRDFFSAAYSELRAIKTRTFHVGNNDDKHSRTTAPVILSDKDREAIALNSRERETSFRLVKEFLRASDIPAFEIDHSRIVDGSAQGLLQAHLGLMNDLAYPFEKIVMPGEQRAGLRRSAAEMSPNTVPSEAATSPPGLVRDIAPRPKEPS
jgi:LPS sulfotransferase NodH